MTRLSSRRRSNQPPTARRALLSAGDTIAAVAGAASIATSLIAYAATRSIAPGLTAAIAMFASLSIGLGIASLFRLAAVPATIKLAYALAFASLCLALSGIATPLVRDSTHESSSTTSTPTSAP